MVSLRVLSLLERSSRMSNLENIADILAQVIQSNIDDRMEGLEENDNFAKAVQTILADCLTHSDYIQADDLEDLVRDEDIGRLVEHEVSYRLDDMVSEDVLEDAVETAKDEILGSIEGLLEKERQSRLEDMETLKEMMVLLTQPKPSIFSKLSSFSLPLPRWFKWFK